MPNKIDDLVKSLKRPVFVIPVETGIQSFHLVCRLWIPACAGMTTFYEPAGTISRQELLDFSKGGTQSERSAEKEK
jgi:hypothetical protein